ncbi:MAG: NAD(P)-dependent oxidoreductase [Chloroflexi bacterium]|nr:NAD(P)-dependent oxidoreductase [Chloroflexota bacterium]
MTQPMRVAVTGGEGMLGRLLAERLDPARFVVRPLGRKEADVTDLAALERAFADTDAVVHLAANSQVGAPWDALVGPNLLGAYHAFEAARRAGVRRVVFASSNHAVGMYLMDADVFADPSRPHLVTPEDPVRPDSLYGATKAWGEALGRLYAEMHELEVVCLRIGWVTEDDRPPTPAQSIREDPEVKRRAPAMWLSHRDCISLIDASLGADLRFGIVNGVSDNAGRWFSLDEGRRLLGWEPADGLR